MTSHCTVRRWYHSVSLFVAIMFVLFLTVLGIAGLLQSLQSLRANEAEIAEVKSTLHLLQIEIKTLTAKTEEEHTQEAARVLQQKLNKAETKLDAILSTGAQR